MINSLNLDYFGRPSWNLYFMTLAIIVSQKSLDPDTKHGTVITSQDNTILSMGYNGPPRGCDDTEVPLSRPAKYKWLIHSETAAIINAAREGVCLKNSIFYITGHPCETCIGEIINVGPKKIYYGEIGSKCVDNETKAIVSKKLENKKIDFIYLPYMDPIKQYLKNTIRYIDDKILSHKEL